jgi:glucokinase
LTRTKILKWDFVNPNLSISRKNQKGSFSPERNPMAGDILYIGMDLGGTNIKAGLVTGDGKILEEREVATEVQGGVDHVLNRMAEVIRGLARTSGQVKVKGAGVGLAGQINVKRGIYHSGPNFPGWSNVPVASELEKRADVPVVIDNDANLAALGEYAFGAGRGVTEMLMVTLGTGVGGGLILNGQLYHGASDAAGEVGHTSIHPDGPVCACGRRGCLEAYVGTRGILCRLKEKLDSGAETVLRQKAYNSIAPKDIGMAAEKGDRIAAEVLQETGDILGFGLANFADILNIERIVVGGGVANAGDLILQPAREALQREALKVVGDACTIVKAELGNTAGLVGAARAAMLAFSAA